MNLASVLCALFTVHIVESSLFTVAIVEYIAYFDGKTKMCAIFTVHIVESVLFTCVDIVESIVYFGNKT